ECLDAVSILVVVGEAGVEHPTDRALYALQPDVVVLADVVVVLPLSALLTVDRVGEVVEGARVGARTIEIDRLIEVNTQVRNLVPVGQRGARLPDRLELLDGQAVHRVVRVNHDGERVVGDGELFVGDAVGGARGRLLITDRPGCI